jgi:hypothetical protein
MSASLSPGEVFQQGFVVADLDRAIQSFSRALGVGAWLRLKDARPWKLIYHGRETTVPLSVALGYGGNTMYELIQQHDDQPSIYQDGVRRSGYGFHHWGIAVEDLGARAAEYQKEGGFPEVSSLAGAQGRALYLDGYPAVSGMVELIELTPGFRSFADLIAGLPQSPRNEAPFVKRL